MVLKLEPEPIVLALPKNNMDATWSSFLSLDMYHIDRHRSIGFGQLYREQVFTSLHADGLSRNETPRHLDPYSFPPHKPLASIMSSCRILFRCGPLQAVGGTLHNVLNGDLEVEFADSLLNNRELLRRVAARNREITGQRRRRPFTYLLPQVIARHMSLTPTERSA